MLASKSMQWAPVSNQSISRHFPNMHETSLQKKIFCPKKENSPPVSKPNIFIHILFHYRILNHYQLSINYSQYNNVNGILNLLRPSVQMICLPHLGWGVKEYLSLRRSGQVAGRRSTGTLQETCL